VNFSQPLSVWDAGLPALTVKQVLSMRTPFFAHPIRFLALALRQQRCYERVAHRE